MLTNKVIYYNDYGIEYDTAGFWTVQYDGDDLMFDTVEDAKKFIDTI